MPMQPRAAQQSRRSDEINRPQPSHETMRQLPQRMSLDAAQRQLNSRTGQQFTSKFPDLLPVDLSPPSGSPESSGTPSTSHRSGAGFPAQSSAAGGASHLYKLDAMMFPSADPFAYPNQPMMEFNLQPQAGQANIGQQEDLQFYLPNTYDGIEGQVLGPIPPYLMQHSQAQGLELPTQMYGASDMLNIQQAQARQAQQAAHQRQQRELEEFLADPGFDMFPPAFR